MSKVAEAERQGALCEIDFWEGRLLAETGALKAASIPLRRVALQPLERERERERERVNLHFLVISHLRGPRRM
jgi:hypothetical protein